MPERWVRGYPLLVEEREWLFVEFKNRKYNLVCVKGNKLTEEFVARWNREMSIASGKTSGKNTEQKHPAHS